LFKDEKGEVLYVGKAASLRNRVRSYFRSSRGLGRRIQRMAERVADLEYIVTDSPVEALILESNLIKQHRPRYNVRFRDDKQYPYLKVTVNEDFPRVLVVRRMKKDGARYFGPYTNSGAMHQTVDAARRLFPYRSCRSLEGKSRPCLNYHIRRCLAPCQGYPTREEYREMINRLCRFLEGRYEEVLKELEREMERAAQNMEFERAAELRDRIQAVKKVVEKQKIVSRSMEDYDLVACARDEEDTCVQVFFVRDGKLMGREHHFLPGTEDLPTSGVLTAFVKQYYENSGLIPRRVLVPETLEEQEDIEVWLARRRSGPVQIHEPKRGDKRRLLQMAKENARLLLAERQAARNREANRWERAARQLKEGLELTGPPRRIECYDISNLQGRHAVGSMVVFEEGMPKKEDYRRFRIRRAGGPDDYGMMREVLYRRFSHGLRERAENQEKKGEGPSPAGRDRFSRFPDLVLVDGGKGQLGAALEVLQQLGLVHIRAAALAKEHEHLYVEGKPGPVVLPKGSDALNLVRRIRDEAHRFAVTYHRNLREKGAVASVLDDIPGVGEKRKQVILQHFGSLRKIQQATVEELAGLPGMNHRVAEAVKEHLRVF